MVRCPACSSWGCCFASRHVSACRPPDEPRPLDVFIGGVDVRDNLARPLSLPNDLLRVGRNPLVRTAVEDLILFVLSLGATSVAVLMFSMQLDSVQDVTQQLMYLESLDNA